MDLSTPIYFYVSTINWETDGLTDEQRLATQTTYTVEFSIERLIGFSRPFEDTSVPLEDGYYLVRTYMSQLDMSETMMDSFNPVYSYIIAEGRELHARKTAVSLFRHYGILSGRTSRTSCGELLRQNGYLYAVAGLLRGRYFRL